MHGNPQRGPSVVRRRKMVVDSLVTTALRDGHGADSRSMKTSPEPADFCFATRFRAVRAGPGLRKIRNLAGAGGRGRRGRPKRVLGILWAHESS